MKKSTLILSLLLVIHFIHAQNFADKILLLDAVDNNLLEGIELADITGDDKKDLILAGGNPNLFFLEGTGDQTFSSITTIYDEELKAIRVKSADLDKDGDLDLIAAFDFDDKLMLFLNDNNGNFTPSILNESVDNVIDIQLVDLDNNGYLDLLFSSYNILDDYGVIGLHLNFGNGEFDELITIIEGDIEAHDLHSIDMDDDGAVDILLASDSQEEVFWLRNNMNGTFDKIMIYDKMKARASAVGDIDQDGDFDVIIGDLFGVTSLINNGNNEFTLGQEWDINPSKISFIDAQKDGFPEIVVSDFVDENVVLIQNNAGDLTNTITILAENIDVAFNLLIGDIDQDEDEDILVVSTLINSVFLIENTSILSATELIDLSSLRIGPNPTSDYLTVQYNGHIILPLQIEIMDSFGNTTWIKNWDSMLSTTLDLTDLKQGVYFLKITDVGGQHIVTEKIIKI